MIAGHFGLAAAAKAGEPRMPLWAAMLATVWLDVVFVPLYLGGIELVCEQSLTDAHERDPRHGAFLRAEMGKGVAELAGCPAPVQVHAVLVA